jgi:hypothetical protein
LVLVGDAAYRLDLQNKTTKMTINAEEGVEDVVEDVGRSPLPQELYQSGGRGEENGAKRRWWLSRVV